jgi:choline dehydrogenase-like flavoprotein
MVGRNYMAHINSVIMAVHPFKKNPTRFQKTLALNDFYFTGSKTGKPLGHIQMRGKIVPENLIHHKDLFIRTFRNLLAPRSIDFWLMTEDLPDPNNRVFVDKDDRVHLIRRPINMQAHLELLKKTKKILWKAGYPLLFTQIRDIRSNQHQCGTLRCGNDPKTAVVDKFCRSFEVTNLFVGDTSIFPSSGAVNPSLTTVANSLRVSDYIKKVWQEESF